MAAHPLFGFLALLLTAGACVMTFLVILAGTKNATPLNQIYFIWADTSGIPSASSITRWTLWNVCGESNGLDVNCGKVKAANPFVPQQNFGSSTNVPHDFVKHHFTYYYLSRFMFAFYIISIFFMVCSFLTGLLALCSRLGSAIASLSAAFSLFCLSFTASVMTAVFVLGRNAFHKDNRHAQLGMKAFAFTWASVACLFLAMVFYCCGIASGRRRRDRAARGLDKEAATPRASRGRRRFILFGRRREVV